MAHFCGCGFNYENQCAHRLSSAIGLHLPVVKIEDDGIRCTLKSLFGDPDCNHIYEHKETGYKCCSRGRIIRAVELLSWYKSRGYSQHSKANPHGDSVVFLPPTRMVSGHIFAIHKDGSVIAPSDEGARGRADPSAQYWY